MTEDMKKIFKYWVPVILCLSVAACQKEVPANDEEVPANENVAPADENVPEGYVTLTFTVDPDVKTAVSGKVVSFVAGDKIKVYWDGGGEAESNEVDLSSGSAQFTATVAEGKSAYYAVYPATADASVSGETLTVDILQNQSGRFANADILVAKTASSSLNLAFHHAVSLLHFTISDGNARGITRAQFVDLANNSQLYGSLEVAFNDANAPTFTPVENTAYDVIDIETVQEGDDNYIAVLPGKVLEGFGLRLGTASAWLPGIVGENSINLSTIRPKLSNIDNKINDGDWYIKADGIGDGTSWEKAGGPALLQSLMGDYAADDAKNLARAWRINGKTIKVAEGNYTDLKGSAGFTARYLPSADIEITIEGGYTTSGTKSSSAKTVFGSDSESSKDENRAFFFYGGVNVILKDLYVLNHTRTGNAGGAAIYAAGNANLSISNSTFSGSIANAHNGGAIRFSGPGKLSMDNCVFTDNAAVGSAANNNQGRGGAVYVDESGVLVIKECLFKDNVGRNGGALALSSSTLKANLCKFIGNHSDGTAYYSATSNGRTGSGTFFMTTATSSPVPVAFFNACEFRGNYAKVTTSNNKQAGNITFGPTGMIGFNNCTLYNNNCTESYRAVWSIQSGNQCVIVNSTMVDDTANGPSQGSYISSTSSVLFNNIIIGLGGAALMMKTANAYTHDFNIISGWYSGSGYNTTNNTNEVTASSLEDGDGTS